MSCENVDTHLSVGVAGHIWHLSQKNFTILVSFTRTIGVLSPFSKANVQMRLLHGKPHPELLGHGPAS